MIQTTSLSCVPAFLVIPLLVLCNHKDTMFYVCLCRTLRRVGINSTTEQRAPLFGNGTVSTGEMIAVILAMTVEHKDTLNIITISLTLFQCRRRSKSEPGLSYGWMLVYYSCTSSPQSALSHLVIDPIAVNHNHCVCCQLFQEKHNFELVFLLHLGQTKSGTLTKS